MSPTISIELPAILGQSDVSGLAIRPDADFVIHGGADALLITGMSPGQRQADNDALRIFTSGRSISSPLDFDAGPRALVQ